MIVQVTRAFETPPSTLAHLRVEYSPDAPAAAPTRLFFKAPRPHKLAAGRREVDFYTTIALLRPAVPLVPCYAAERDETTGVSSLLLADLSSTHAQPPNPPSWEQLAAMVDGLARLHAAWWGEPRLSDLTGERPEDLLAADFDLNARHWRELITLLGDRLAPAQRRIYERFLAAAPALLRARLTGGGPLTLLHAENHAGNFLVPRVSGQSVCLIDWHQYRCWWGLKDVAVLMARAAAPEHQPAAERLLRAYHARLLANGVTDYPWAACWHDYRLAVIDNLAYPLRMWQSSHVVAALNVSLYAFHAGECEELLGI